MLFAINLLRKYFTIMTLLTTMKPVDKRKQPPSLRRGYLPGKCLSVRGIGGSWKIVCVRGLDRAFWKMNICSMKKIEAPEKFVLVNEYLSDEIIRSVRRTDSPSWKIVKRLLLEKKNRYF